MKRIVSLAICLLATLMVMAGHLTPGQAEQRAREFLDKKAQKAVAHGLRLAKRQPLLQQQSSSVAAYYVFNVGQDEGFVMVSGDDRTPAILGYADHGAFTDEPLPPHIQAWFDGIADQLAYLERTDARYEAPRMELDYEPVEPLLSSFWNQDAPYNGACPIDPSTGERSVTGCVATAMAQVLNYYQYPNQTTAPIPSYTSVSNNISMPEIPVTTIDWENMLNQYNSRATETQRQAVAQLMLLCGQSVKMDYGSKSSGAVSHVAVNAFQNYFGYDKTVRVLERTSFSTAEWESMLYAEVSNGRPVLYGGSSTGGGHAFVVDGYDGDGLFHINWGWGGQSDGYFLISVLNPNSTAGIGSSSSNDGYSYDQDAVIGIQYGSGEFVPERLTVREINLSGSSTFTRSSSSADFTNVILKTVAYNVAGLTLDEFKFGIALFNADEEWVGDDVLRGQSYGVLPYLNGREFTTYLSFGAGLADGDYYLVPVSKTTYSTEWEPCYGANVFRIKATIAGNTLTLTEPSVSLTATLQTTGKTEVFSSLPLHATITNNGSYYNDYVYLLYENGGKFYNMGGKILEVGAGETVDFDISYVPNYSGTNHIYLTYQSKNGYTPFAMTDIEVAPMPSNLRLNSTFTLTNATGSVVTDDFVEGQILVTNVGGDYDKNIRLVLGEKGSGNTFYSVDMQTQQLVIDAGQSTTFDFSFHGLEPGKEYLIWMMYVNNGSWVSSNGQAHFFVEIPTPTYSVSATPADATQGSVTVSPNGNGTYEDGSTVTLTATPAEGYHFAQWSDGTTNNPYTLTVNGDISLQAQFAPNEYAIIYMVRKVEWARDNVAYGSPIVLRDIADTELSEWYDGWLFQDGIEYVTMPAHDVIVVPSIVLGVSSVAKETTLVDVYDLSGRLVRSKVARAALSKLLPAGIYLVEGRKFVVR